MKFKVIYLALALVLIFSMAAVIVPANPALAQTIWTVDDDGPADFTTIQAAVDAASPNDTIFVRAGMYVGAIVEKRLNIQGEGASVVTVTNSGGGHHFCFEVNVDGCRISGFTLSDSIGGIGLQSSYGLVEDCVLLGTEFGIHSWEWNEIRRCTFQGNWHYAMNLMGSNQKIWMNNFYSGAIRVTSLPQTFNSGTTIDYRYQGSEYSTFLGNFWASYSGSDSNGDGIGDIAHSFGDLNTATDNYPLIEPYEQYELLCALEMTATNTGTAFFCTDSGTISGLEAISESSLTCPPESKPNLVFPHGFFSFDITGLTPGQSVDVTITLPNALAIDSEYWKCHPIEGGWVQIPMSSNDGDNVIVITLVDGGVGDDDGVADGTIRDQGGPGQGPTQGPTGATGVPVFPTWYVGLAAALGAGVLAYLYRRRVLGRKTVGI